MIRLNTSPSDSHRQPARPADMAPVYTREAFRAILARQPEWKIRAALEEGNIPSSNIEHALEWLAEQQRAH